MCETSPRANFNPLQVDLAPNLDEDERQLLVSYCYKVKQEID